MSSSKFESFNIMMSSESSGGSKPTEVLSDFGDGACGEPAFSQHLVLDFTPDAEIDNEISQKKICDFWKFINSTPEIKNLMVKPEKNLFTGDSQTEVAPESVKSEIEVEDSSVVDVGLGQAVHMLGFAEEKNLINTLFEAKLPQSMCSLGSREYKQTEVVTQPMKKEKKKHVCKCIPCRNPKCRNKRASNTSSEELSPLRTLCRKMNEWDAEHPNCYAFHPLIQRFVRLWRYVQVVSDVITFVLSMLCCQCSDAMPLSSSASVETKPSIQVFEGYRRFPTEPGRSSSEPMKLQNTVIDVTPGRKGTPEVQERSQEIWQSAKNRAELEGMMERPSPKPGPSKRQLIDLSRDPVHPEIVVEQNNSNLPGIHMARNNNRTGRVFV